MSDFWAAVICYGFIGFLVIFVLWSNSRQDAWEER